MVEAAPAQQLEFQAFVVATAIAHHEDDGGVEQSQQELDLGEAAEVLREVFRVLRDGAAVEVGDAEVEQDVEEVGEVEKGLVGTVGGVAEEVLHLAVDAQNPERLHQQVEKQQEDDIFDEAVLHCLVCVCGAKVGKKLFWNDFQCSFWKYCVFLPPDFAVRNEIICFFEMNKEQEDIEVLEEELVENEKSLLLINDDVNTFEYVIDTLMKVCHHTREQAETCAWITHYKGKCAVMHGTFEELKPYYDILLGHQLTVKITD